MNEVFLIGKIISDIELKFIINSKNKAIACFEIETNDKQIVRVQAYNKLADFEAEKAKVEKEIKKLEGEIKRGEGMLSNPNFTSKAPAAKVEEEKAKLEDYRSKYAAAKEKLAKMN